MAARTQRGEEPTRSPARMLGAASAWALPLSKGAVLEQLTSVLGGAEVESVEPLGGSPLVCRDLKAMAVESRAEGRVLVADISRMGPAGCAAVRLGACVAVAEYDGAWCVVGAGRAFLQEHPDVRTWLDAACDAPLPDERELAEALAAQAGQWRATSDAAQVVASYLRCHPRVASVRYPGLTSDPSFAVAARTLTGGFGPLVDYRLVGEDWRRICCTDEDPRTQVIQLEARLR